MSIVTCMDLRYTCGSLREAAANGQLLSQILSQREIAFLVAVTFFMSMVNSGRSSAKEPQCVSRIRGVVFPSFTAYPVAVKTIIDKRPAILATPHDQLFRTRTREAARSEPNFAGHYEIKSWGCGTDCSQLIVDRETGRVYDPPFANVTYHYPPTEDGPHWDCFDDLPSFYLTSRPLVVEGCLNGSGSCGRHFYLMGNDGLREMKYDPDKTTDGKIAPYQFR